MKYIITILLSLVTTSTIQAKCGFGSIQCVSQTGTLNQNGLIMLQFYSSSEDVVPQLNKKHPAYLQSEGQKVPLEVIEVFKGDFRVTEVLLKPSLQLHVGSTYSLYIDRLSATDNMMAMFEAASNNKSIATFRITTPDHNAPLLQLLPGKAGSIFESYGCGPEEYVVFKIEGEDDSELFARVTVRRKGELKTKTYILNIESNTINIGHGMCSGPFRFDDGDQYEASFQLTDQSGNTSVATAFIPFERPEQKR